MCNHCLSLDLCLIRCDSLFCCCLKIKKERMIVSWTIKGSDTCFRLLWGRTITELRINNTASNTWPQTHTSPTTSSAANIYCSHLSALPVMTSSSVFLAPLTLGGGLVVFLLTVFSSVLSWKEVDAFPPRSVLRTLLLHGIHPFL